MSLTTTPHLNFRGDARAALEFYASAVGGRVVAMTYRDAGIDDGAHADLISWGQVATDAGFRVMAYDAYPQLAFSRGDDPFFVSLRGTDAEELTAIWTRLAEGADIRQPLAPAAWSPLYGQLTDRFGITWVLDLEVAWGA